MRARGSTLMSLFGIGPAGAARLLVDVGDITRFPSRHHSYSNGAERRGRALEELVGKVHDTSLWVPGTLPRG